MMWMCVCTQSFSRVQFFATLWTVACQALLSLGLSCWGILGCVVISYSRGSSQPRDWTLGSCIVRQIFHHWVTKEAQSVGILFLFSRKVVSDSLWAHGPQHARLPCLSLSPSVCLDSHPLSWWCYLPISFSAVPFSFCLQSFSASGSFPKTGLSTSGRQSIGASASVLPMNIQDWFPLGLTGLTSLQSKGLSRVFFNTIV